MTNDHDPQPTAAAPEAHPTVPWPVVDSYSGGADQAGLHSRVRLRFGDGPETVEYVPAAAAPDVLAMRDALQGLVSVIEAASPLNLSRGVELGQTVWYVKCSDAMDAARAALSAQGEAKPEPRAAEPVSALDDDLLTHAASLLEGYVEFIRTVGMADIELHPYLPEIEDVAEQLRTLAAASPIATPEPQEGRKPAEWNAETDDFEVHLTMPDGEEVMIAAKASGPRDAALAEALNYARQYEDEGPVQVFEVRRTPIGGITQDGGRDQ